MFQLPQGRVIWLFKRKRIVFSYINFALEFRSTNLTIIYRVPSSPLVAARGKTKGDVNTVPPVGTSVANLVHNVVNTILSYLVHNLLIVRINRVNFPLTRINIPCLVYVYMLLPVLVLITFGAFWTCLVDYATSEIKGIFVRWSFICHLSQFIEWQV